MSGESVEVALDAGRDKLVAAIDQVQVKVRVRRADAGVLADDALRGWAAVRRLAEAVGLDPLDLGVTATWWHQTAKHAPPGELGLEHTLVGLSTYRGYGGSYGRWLVRRGAPHNVSRGFLSLGMIPPETLPTVGYTPAAPAIDLAPVGDLFRRLGAQDARLGDQLVRVRKLVDCEPLSDPDAARDAVEDAARLLDGILELARCRLCGCRQHSPCETGDGPCGWSEPDLCTACVDVARLLAAPPPP